MGGYEGMRTSKRLVAAVLTVSALSIGITSWAATEHWNDASLQPKLTTATTLGDKTDWNTWKNGWASIRDNREQVSLAPGRVASELNFGWYSLSGAAKVRISTQANMANAKEFTGTTTEGAVVNNVQYLSNKVTVTGLKANTNYWYQVQVDGKWKKAEKYATKSFDSFSFLFMGDPQIGASINQTPSDGDAKQGGDMANRNDSFNWNRTLNQALAQHKDINFIVSAGDQINEVAPKGEAEKLLLQEQQYSGFLGAKALRSMPLASTIGNHDSQTQAYGYHFNTPNPFTQEQSPTKAGHGYYYNYGPALFIVLNTNNYNAADHEALIKKAIAQNPNAKWRIVMIHQDIYGTGLDHSDSDGIILRTQLTPIFDKYHVDAVLQGHDHTYARSYQLSGDAKQHQAFDKKVNLKDAQIKADFLEQNKCYTITDKHQGKLINPKGIFYMTANSATGSKFYELIPVQQDYIAARSQTWRPTYSVVKVTANSFTIDTYDVETGNRIDDSYTIVKE